MVIDNCCDRLICRDLPGSILNLLKTLVKEKISIVLNSGEQEDCLEVQGVVGNLLVATFDGNFKFVDISCICAVIVDCETVLDAVLKGRLCRNDCNSILCRTVGPNR